jgi:small subunit ribosomal protein S8
MTDPISDMIIRMKNAAMAGKEHVSVPQSSLKAAVAQKLKQRGIIATITPHGKKTSKTLDFTLARRDDGSFTFADVKRISKPGRRVYVGAQTIGPVRGGTGTLLVSTPKGVLFGDEARKENVGGEALFEIW